MWNKLSLFLIVIFGYQIQAFCQNCELQLKGQIIDLSTGTPIMGANINLQNLKKGAFSDSAGFFQINDLCPGAYHINFSHIGCESQRKYIELNQDTSIFILMDHFDQIMDEVIIQERRQRITLQETSTLSEAEITARSHNNLGQILENVSGLSLIKNGSSISKPVVHGLYGNRLLILNNGIPQSGQQWGNDHAPEIDPLVANSIKVIKGTAAVEYPGSGLGSVVLVEPKAIDREPHIHGRVAYFMETNGRGHSLNTQIQQYRPDLAWKFNVTAKKSGDRKTPDYYLNNTGVQELNFALQLEKSLSERWHSDVYLSSFNSQIGVLRGSHIGNLTDLERAINREEPFFTESSFSYNIDAPRQLVNHQLWKAHSKYFLTEHQWMDITYAGQWNKRREFDVRRSGRSDIPALSLNQFSHYGAIKYAYQPRPKDPNLPLESKFNHETMPTILRPDITINSGL